MKVGLVSLVGGEYLGSRANVFNDTEPLGLLYIGGVAKETGCEVKLFHSYQKANPNETSIISEIIKYKPDILGISSMTNTFNRSMALAKKIKRDSLNTRIFLGGDHIGTNPSDIGRYDEITAGVYGEGEATFKEILEGRPLSKVAGIAYFDSTGELQINPPRQRITDRTKLSLPIRDSEIIKVSKIGNLMYPSPPEQTGVASLLFQFGCPMGCTYCSATTLYGSKLTRSSPEFVVSEMKQLKKQFGINTAFFTDLTFNLNHKLSEALCEEIEKANLGISWYALVRPTSPSNQPILRDSTLEVMVASGCTKIGFGIESFGESAMQDYHRPTSLSTDNKVLRKIDELGALSKVFLIMGHPDEKIEYYNQIIEKLKWLKPDEVRISFLTPFPGTPLWNNLGNKKSELLTKNYDDYTTFKPVMRMKHISPNELINQKKRILQEYYGSEEFKNHIGKKINKNPHFEKSFDEFKLELKERDLL